ncbi:MAG: AMP-binding protein [Cyclobacteriaceae bacterium]|nr:AMP-binding protein [Cyclobacteriaceae bacterium]
MEALISLNGKQYSLSDIKSGLAKDSTSSQENSVFQFCHTWLNGKNSYVLQTSGTTGAPKKISVTRDQLCASAKLTADYLGLKKGLNALLCLDINYIAGVMMLVRSLESGMNMYVTDPAANPFDKISSTTQIDFTALVPYQVQAILKSKSKHRLHEGIFLIGGAPVPKKTFEELQSYSGKFYATYGMTETLSHIALQRLNGENPANFFQVLSGISVHVDERGCLIINAPHINPNLIVTNDLVELIGYDKFIWLGRADTIINSGGIKIIPEKMEAVIELIFNELTLENRFFIAGFSNAELGQAVTLVIEGKLSITQEQRLAERLKQKLNRYEVPKSIRYTPAFVETDTKKINKTKTLETIQN